MTDTVADMKVGQADKFIEARTNGSFSRALLQVKELSPEQAEHQTRLRKLTQVSVAYMKMDEADIRLSSRHLLNWKMGSLS